MKKLTTQINESLQTVVNEASNPLAKNIESLFKRIGLRELKLKVPDVVDHRLIIGKLLMEPSDAGMLQPCFSSMNIEVSLTSVSGKDNTYIVFLQYDASHTDGQNRWNVNYETTDNGKTWIDRKGKSF